MVNYYVENTNTTGECPLVLCEKAIQNVENFDAVASEMIEKFGGKLFLEDMFNPEELGIIASEGGGLYLKHVYSNLDIEGVLKKTDNGVLIEIYLDNYILTRSYDAFTDSPLNFYYNLLLEACKDAHVEQGDYVRGAMDEETYLLLSKCPLTVEIPETELAPFITGMLCVSYCLFTGLSPLGRDGVTAMYRLPVGNGGLRMHFDISGYIDAFETADGVYTISAVRGTRSLTQDGVVGDCLLEVYKEFVKWLEK